MDPRIRCRNKLKPPAGWDEIKQMILELNQQMKIAESTSQFNTNTKEKLWRVMQCNWKRSRPVYEMRYKKKTMSNALYNWIISQGYADNELIQAWRKPGYDRLCCVACISKNTDHGGTCICRVPRDKRDPNIKCFHCGCPGCCSGDFSDSDDDHNLQKDSTKTKIASNDNEGQQQEVQTGDKI